MMQVVKGSIFDSSAQSLVNPVNTVGVMGAGLALKFKQKYPEMFERYRSHCLAIRFQVGMLQVYQASDGKKIFNFPTKRHWQDKSQLKYIEAGLQKFTTTYKEKGIVSVAFPKLGCGLGGLNWKQQVEPLMREYLGSLDIPVYFYV